MKSLRPTHLTFTPGAGADNMTNDAWCSAFLSQVKQVQAAHARA